MSRISTDRDPIVADTSDGALVAAILRHGLVLAEQWTRIQGGLVMDQPHLLLTIVGEPVAFTNGIQRARLRPEDADRRIDEVVDVLRSHGVPATWWVAPGDTPADLGERLEAHGFRHHYDLPWMACSLDGYRGHHAEVPLRIERVDGPDGQDLWLKAFSAGFGMDERERHAMARLGDAVGYAPEAPWQRFFGLVDDRPVACSGVQLGGGVAGVYSVTTAPWLRGRGVLRGDAAGPGPGPPGGRAGLGGEGRSVVPAVGVPAGMHGGHVPVGPVSGAATLRRT